MATCLALAYCDRAGESLGEREGCTLRALTGNRRVHSHMPCVRPLPFVITS